MISMYLIDRSPVIVQARERRNQPATQSRHAPRSLVRRHRRIAHRIDGGVVEIPQRLVIVRPCIAVGDGGEVVGIERILGDQRLQRLTRLRVITDLRRLLRGLERELLFQGRIRG